MQLGESIYKNQFSAKTLFVITLICAISLAISRIDSLLVPLAFPFTLGPLAAHRVTKTKFSLIVGTLSSLFCSLVGIGPFFLIAFFLIWTFGLVGDQLLSQSLLVVASIAYFGAVAVLGGYAGANRSKIRLTRI